MAVLGQRLDRWSWRSFLTLMILWFFDSWPWIPCCKPCACHRAMMFAIRMDILPHNLMWTALLIWWPLYVISQWGEEGSTGQMLKEHLATSGLNNRAGINRLLSSNSLKSYCSLIMKLWCSSQNHSFNGGKVFPSRLPGLLDRDLC